MKIVNAMLGQGLGGIEQALVDYCEATQFSGHEAHAIVHPDAQVLPALLRLGVTVHRLTNFGAWDPVAAFRLKCLLKKLKPDACIAHGNRAVSLLCKAGKGQRVVGVLHNYKIRHEPLQFLFYPTQDLLRHAQEKSAGKKHCCHIPNLVRVPVSEPVRDWHNPPVIGAMGRFVTKKGFDLFVETMAVLKERGLNFRAVLAGDGEEAQKLKTLAMRRNVTDTLEFPGWVENKQEFFNSIDIFCLPSYHEPFGIVLLEAMAQALPVAAIASEGPSEILHDGVDGTLIPKNDAGAITAALIQLLTDSQHAELLARNAYDTVKRNYDLPVVAHKLDLALRALTRI